MSIADWCATSITLIAVTVVFALAWQLYDCYWCCHHTGRAVFLQNFCTHHKGNERQYWSLWKCESCGKAFKRPGWNRFWEEGERGEK
jgi:hypothetical protein